MRFAIFDFRMRRMFNPRFSGLNRNAAKQGFTLVELLISIVILAIGIVAILHALERALFAIGSARDHLWGSILLKEKAAEIDIALLSDDETAPASESGGFDDPYEAFSWASDVEETEIQDENWTNRLYSIELKVWRRDVDRVYRTYTFRTR